MSSSAVGTAPFLAKVHNLTDNDGHSVTQFLPAGTVLPFAGTTAPAGFLLCNGATISRTTYSKLYAAIGSAHGAGDGSTTFHLPDYRGRFLRGADGGAARDPNAAARTAANSGGATGDNVGSVQGNATAKNGLGNTTSGVSGSATSGGVDHSHTQNTNTGFAGAGQPYVFPNVGPYFWSGYGNSGMPTQGASAWAHTHGLSGTAAAQTISGDAETRPVNANVNYIIKI